jgi:hypothetical protein
MRAAGRYDMLWHEISHMTGRLPYAEDVAQLVGGCMGCRADWQVYGIETACASTPPRPLKPQDGTSRAR